MIAAAVAGPTPGRASSWSAVAVFRSTGGATVVGEAPPEAAPPPPSVTGPRGAASPTRGTYPRAPAVSGDAWLTRSPSASAVRPPAATRRSATREPGARRYTPGRATAPAACTTSSAGGVDPRLVPLPPGTDVAAPANGSDDA